MSTTADLDQQFREILLQPLRVCAQYKPKLGGGGEGTSVEEFMILYGSDPLYRWIGFDTGLMYAAHKAAGGLTSLYRQLGIGCERLIRAVLQQTLELSDENVDWGFEIEKEDGSKGWLALDARLELAQLKPQASKRFNAWLTEVGKTLGLDSSRIEALDGAVFEIRQGYKSADSKRQNADLRFGIRAYNQNYLPVLMVVSTQVNYAVLRRYKAAQMYVLVGTISNSPLESTFAFCRSVVGYDLAGFFDRNHEQIKSEVTAVLEGLLTP